MFKNANLLTALIFLGIPVISIVVALVWISFN